MFRRCILLFAVPLLITVAGCSSVIKKQTPPERQADTLTAEAEK